MSRARFIVGDVHDVLATIPDGSVDFALTSPPFLALRSYLPAGHPDKDREIGSEATPADFLDTLLALTAEWGRVLAPHGSLAVELGDTYAGSGGAGGDYNAGGMRDLQPRFAGSGSKHRMESARPGTNSRLAAGPGWPLDKSLCGIPQAYMLSLSYGRNVLTGEPSPAGMWRVRTLKPWIRTNPPVGALGDKDRPATSYVIVATRARDRWFDLDAVRTAPLPHTLRYDRSGGHYSNDGYTVEERGDGGRISSTGGNPAGAPPLDWWHEVDAVLDAALRQYANGTTNPRTAKGIDRRENTGKAAAPGRGGGWSTLDVQHGGDGTIRGWHLRRALEAAGILSTAEALDVTAKGYSGAHYAVWPPELCRQLIEEMCPRRVCRTCGQPSRRVTETVNAAGRAFDHAAHKPENERRTDMASRSEAPRFADRRTLGWSSCGCTGTDGLRLDGYHTGPGWRPGLVLDPFVGSGTTLEVATGHGRDAIGIDLDLRNAVLALDRVGPLFLDVTWPDPDLTLPTLPVGQGDEAYRPWRHLLDITDRAAGQHVIDWLTACGTPDPPTEPAKPRSNGRAIPPLAGQLDMWTPPNPQPEEATTP